MMEPALRTEQFTKVDSRRYFVVPTHGRAEEAVHKDRRSEGAAYFRPTGATRRSGVLRVCRALHPRNSRGQHAPWCYHRRARADSRRLEGTRRRSIRRVGGVLDFRMKSWLDSRVNAPRNTSKPAAKIGSKRDIFFFTVVGLGAGATLVSFAFLPEPQATALIFTGAFWVALLAFRLYREAWSGTSPGGMTKAVGVYVVVVAVVLAVAWTLTGTVIRSNEAWAQVAWVLGVLVFVATSSGAWLVGERATRGKTPSA